MEAFEYKIKNTIVLELRGRVDEFNTSILRDELETILNTGKFWIVLDLSKTKYISAHCLRAVWSASRRAHRLGGLITLIGLLEPQVKETVGFVGFDKVVSTFETLEGALSHIEEQRAGAKTPGAQPEAPGRISGTMIKEVIKKWLKVGVILCALTQGMDLKHAHADDNTYTLEEVLNVARESSGQIRLARLRMQEKDADVRITKSAGLPKMLGSVGYLYQNNPTIAGDIINRELNGVRSPATESNIDELKTRTKVEIESDVTVISLGAAQVLYSGGLLKHQTALKEAQRNEADAQYKSETLAIEEQLRNAYIGLLLVRQKLELLRTQKRALSQRFEAVKRARDAKTISEIQFAELEVLNLKADQERLSAERDEQSLRGILNIAIGRSIEAPLTPVPVSMEVEGVLESAEHYFNIALHRYPDLKKTMSLIDSAAAYQKLINAQGLFSPTAAMFGTLDQVQGVGAQRGMSWSLGVGVIVPIYDGGKSLAEFEKATTLSSQARIAHEETEKKLLIEINDVITRIRQARLQIELAKKTAEIAAKRKLEAARAVEEGQLPQYRLGESESAELETKIAVIAAQAELYRWHTRLLVLTGQFKS